MQDILTRVETLRRPGLLVRAARAGQSGYDRARTMRRLFKEPPKGGQVETLVALLSLEAVMNDQRLSQDGRYSPLRHVDASIAILAEARALKLTRLQTKSSDSSDFLRLT